MVSSDPEHNVYSSHIENIRCIAEYIEEEAGRYNIHQVLSDDPDGPVSTVSALQLKVLQGISLQNSDLSERMNQ